MSAKALLCAWVVCSVVCSIAAAEPPRVRIESPANGLGSDRMVAVRGTISDHSIKRATIVVNGAPKGLSVSDGRFSTTLVMSPGQNTIQVVASNKDGVGQDFVTLFSRVPAKDVKVVLTWDTDQTDVDLHVVDPKQEECYYSHQDTKIGGRLDQDVTTGYGPETFTLANAIPGVYQVRAKYYSDHGYPLTFVRVFVILYEGTEREERRSYDGVLLKTDEIVHIGSFEVTRTSLQ